MSKETDIKKLEQNWLQEDRWDGITRTYSAQEVLSLRGSFPIEYTVARMGAERFWHDLQNENVISALGAVTGNQAVESVQAGLKAIYCSGWQVAADNNSIGTMYPDQSLYPVDSVPKLVEKINNSLLRTDEIHWAQGDDSIDETLNRLRKILINNKIMLE